MDYRCKSNLSSYCINVQGLPIKELVGERKLHTLKNCEKDL